MNEVQQLEQAIAALESQRETLGEAVLELALAPLRARLAALQQAGSPATGAPGAPDAPAAPSNAAAVGAQSEERRKLVSVLFADLVGFTSLAENRDPEDVREILAGYVERWAEVVQRYGGVIEKYIGDAVMAVFGLHTAQENDPERAIRAALDMRAALEKINRDLEAQRGVRLAMRVGIHTGQAVVSLLSDQNRRSDGQNFGVVGDTVNLASRLQSVAPPGAILISHDTYRHVRGVFTTYVQEPVRVKGRREPVQVYQIAGAKPRAFHIAERSIEGIETRLVGRTAELKALQDALEHVIEHGRQRMVTIVGEAGIGKSRLLYEFDNWAELLPTVMRLFRGRASPYLEKQPYSLLRDLFSFRFQILESDPPEVVREKMIQGIQDPEAAVVIGEFFGFHFDQAPTLPPSASPDQVRLFRQKALEHLSDYFQRLSSEAPVVLLLEDLHFADESSLDLLNHLEGRFQDRRLLILAAARPTLLERRPKWGQGLAFHTLLTLVRLSPEDSRRLVDEVLQKVEHVPDALRELLVSSAEGNPYYLEELVKVLIEDGVILKNREPWQIAEQRLAGLRVPQSLTGVLQARFDSFPAVVRRILQQAAIVGRTFWDAALVELNVHAEPPARLAPEEIHAALEWLQQRGIVNRRTKSAFKNSDEFIFRNALLRDVVYESILRRVRRELHAGVARWLEQETGRSQRAGELAALIAGHYERAENPEAAAAWYQRAGEGAARRFANHEAIHNLSRAFELIPPAEAARRYDVLLAREKVADVMGDRQAQQTDLDQLARLADALADDARRAEILVRQASRSFFIGDYPSVIAAAGQAIPLAQASGRLNCEADAHMFWGRALAWTGEHDQAAGHFERALSLARQCGLPDLEADILWNLAVVESNQGRYDPAHELLEQALEIYRRTGNVSGESTVLGQVGVVLLSQGDHAGAQTHFEAALELYRQIGHRSRESIILNNLGIVAYELGFYGRAERFFKESLEISGEIEDRFGAAIANTNIGDTLRDTGCYTQGERFYTKALIMAFELGDKMLESILHAGICLLRVLDGRPQEALEPGRAACRLTHEINVPLYELQAHSRYARAMEASGQLEEAAEAYEHTLNLARQLELPNRAIEAQAGLMSLRLAQGDLSGAAGLIEPIWAHLQGSPLVGADEPLRVRWVCVQAFTAMNDPRRREALEQARQHLQRQAEDLEGERRETFLTAVRINRAIQEAGG